MPVLESIVVGAEKAGEMAVEVAKKSVEVAKEVAQKSIEIAKNQVENVKNAGDAVKSKLDDIENLTPEQLREKVDSKGDVVENDDTSEVNKLDEYSDVKESLTDEEIAKIKEETGWSDEIIDSIGSVKEYEIYRCAGLQEDEIGGKKCLIRSDIDWEQKDAMGRTNKERAEQGLSPINKEGKVIELHHIGQHADSPLAELNPDEHRGKGNDAILHDKTKESEIDRQVFAGERSSHWEARANDGGNL
ncbi:HNH/ENDO VII family nuclease [Lachnoanaerobaculum sp. Marseille-Q4761]|uniref:HNH/ENDO VII family nuclease n=1 Tax=Lachnoanaerobaculum sp. Marseille-Q4761 TaxID=2819511 RepID=UPI001AA0CA42|nr:HNH/ENDO VII family nuclease [Lachnoanaerobaculum sp. Marseille-Q4761]MBO1869751.1 HNH/ENDO VII family nuclease [Lachnoanaerobaculum sp. Marseille-Q4761]